MGVMNDSARHQRIIVVADDILYAHSASDKVEVYSLKRIITTQVAYKEGGRLNSIRVAV